MSTVQAICEAIIKAAGVGGAVVLTPGILTFLGFTATGVIAGSIAAKLMSLLGIGWLTASLPSLGTGLGWFAISVLSVSGAFVGKIISHVCNVTVKYESDLCRN